MQPIGFENESIRTRPPYPTESKLGELGSGNQKPVFTAAFSRDVIPEPWTFMLFRMANRED